MKEILIVEDNMAMAMTLSEYIECDDYNITMVHTGKDALAAIETSMPTGVLLDLNLPDIHGFEVLKSVRNLSKSCAVLVITGEASMGAAVEAMQYGANDFVPKPVSQERLKVSVKNALAHVDLVEIVQTYEKTSRTGFQDFVGKSPKMQAVYTILENGSQSKASVFITGESGVGKELAARAVHNLSPRANKPLEILNCAAIPHNLLESEIFGHMKGAFTGAVADREGAALRADGGTLFLDELTEMPMELQAKLLRFIQSGTFTPVGGTNMQEVDVRFVCATNRDPMAAVKQGILREDLFYRLNVIPVQLPALRERGNDILVLADYFLQKAAEEEGKDFKDFSPAVKNLFSHYNWPGNVRELENTIRRIVVLNTGATVELEMLNSLERMDTGIAAPDAINADAEIPQNESIQNSSVHISDRFLPSTPDDIRDLKDYEQDVIEAALSACDGNITETSKRLGINPATIHRKQKQWSKA